MKKDLVTSIYKDVFGADIDNGKLNKVVRGVFINFGDERGDIFVRNSNFGTRRKYMDFTEGKKEAGLHPLQIVFCGVDWEKASGGRYLGKDNKVHNF